MLSNNNPGVGEYNITQAKISSKREFPILSFNKQERMKEELINKPGPSTYKPIFVNLKRGSNAVVAESAREIDVKIER